MGQAMIISGGAKGQYQITRVTERRRIKARLADIDALLTLIQSQLSVLGTKETEKETELLQQQSIVENLLPGLRNGSIKIEAVNQAVEPVLRTQLEISEIKKEIDRLKIQRVALEGEKAFLTLKADKTLSVWCADLTEDWPAGIAPTIELPDGDVMIAPGNLTGAKKPAWSGSTHGMTQPIQAAPTHGAIFNQTLEPAAEKWRPTYRKGVITERTGNFADVALDNASDDQKRRINLNQSSQLKRVPIKYMSCDGNAFTVGDRVIVRFIDRDWKKPEIVGFESNPKPCGGWVETFGAPVYALAGNNTAAFAGKLIPGGDGMPFSKGIFLDPEDNFWLKMLTPAFYMEGWNSAPFKRSDTEIPNIDITYSKTYISADHHKLIVTETAKQVFTKPGTMDVGVSSFPFNYTQHVLIFPHDAKDFLIPGGGTNLDTAIPDDWTVFEVVATTAAPIDYPPVNPDGTFGPRGQVLPAVKFCFFGSMPQKYLSSNATDSGWFVHTIYGNAYSFYACELTLIPYKWSLGEDGQSYGGGVLYKNSYTAYNWDTGVESNTFQPPYKMWGPYANASNGIYQITAPVHSAAAITYITRRWNKPPEFNPDAQIVDFPYRQVFISEAPVTHTWRVQREHVPLLPTPVCIEISGSGLVQVHSIRFLKE